MDAHFKNFLRIYMDIERGYENTGNLRRTLWSFKGSYVELIRTEFEQVMSDETFGPEEYEDLTAVEFPDKETLHTYLREMYDYLFGDAPEQPIPPE